MNAHLFSPPFERTRHSQRAAIEPSTAPASLGEFISRAGQMRIMLVGRVVKLGYVSPRKPKNRCRASGGFFISRRCAPPVYRPLNTAEHANELSILFSDAEPLAVGCDRRNAEGIA